MGQAQRTGAGRRAGSGHQPHGRGRRMEHPPAAPAAGCTGRHGSVRLRRGVPGLFPQSAGGALSAGRLLRGGMGSLAVHRFPRALSAGTGQRLRVRPARRAAFLFHGPQGRRNPARGAHTFRHHRGGHLLRAGEHHEIPCGGYGTPGNHLLDDGRLLLRHMGRCIHQCGGGAALRGAHFPDRLEAQPALSRG